MYSKDYSAPKGGSYKIEREISLRHLSLGKNKCGKILISRLPRKKINKYKLAKKKKIKM